MNSLRRTLLYFLVTALSLGFLVYAFLPPPVSVDAAPVNRGTLEITVKEDGKTRIKERYVVSTPLAGELLRVTLHPGDRVEAGKTIVAVIEPGDPSLLDSRSRAEAEARVKAAEARQRHAQTELDRANTSYEFADGLFRRIESLMPTKAETQEAYDIAQHRLRTASQDLQASEFSVKIAEFELEQARAALTHSFNGDTGNYTGTDDRARAPSFEIRSPITGVVLRVFQESVALLAAGEKLLEIGDLNQLEIEVDVLSTDAVRIKPGAKMYLEHWGAKEPLLARVRLVEPQAFLKVSALGVEEQRVNVLADFVNHPDASQTLGDAFRVETRIVIWEGQDVLKTNAAAMFRHRGGWAVYRIENGRAWIRKVEVGESSGLETQILSGLMESDQVVAYPSDQLHDGVRVALRPEFAALRLWRRLGSERTNWLLTHSLLQHINGL